MASTPARPAGADNFLKWRRTIDEHLELGRLTWDEYGGEPGTGDRSRAHRERLARRPARVIDGQEGRGPIIGEGHVGERMRPARGLSIYFPASPNAT